MRIAAFLLSLLLALSNVYAEKLEFNFPLEFERTLKTCDNHPEVKRDTVRRARDAGHGIKKEHLSKLIETRVKVPLGGDPCADEYTPRGKASSAVGALLYAEEPHCSGVLVSSTVVLTSAHCILSFDPARFKFLLGPSYREPVQVSKVYKAIPHRQYDERRLGVNDLGAIFLSSRITEVEPVQLSSELFQYPRYASLVHVGYGLTGPLEGVRRCVDIPIDESCEENVSYSTTNMNTCHGDSGGGVFFDESGKVFLVGLITWGDESCSDFGIDMNLANPRYIQWIKSQIDEASTIETPYAETLEHVRLRSGNRFDGSPDELFDSLGSVEAERVFGDRYKGKWVTWSAQVKKIMDRSPGSPPRSCGIEAVVGRERNKIVFAEYREGCNRFVNETIHFTAKLLALRRGYVEMAFPHNPSEQERKLDPTVQMIGQASWQQFASVFFGKERLVQNHENGNCDPQLGLKYGLTRRLSSMLAAEFAVGAKYNTDLRTNSSVFADVTINAVFGNSFMGTGLSFWDLTEQDTRAVALLIQFGLPVSNDGRWKMVGELRAPLDQFDDIGNNYQLWAGVRYKF